MNHGIVNTESNVIENVVVLEKGAQWVPPEGFIVVPLADSFGIGDIWDGSQFIRAPEPVVKVDPDVVQPISNGTQTL